jgi:hypothetical protein
MSEQQVAQVGDERPITEAEVIGKYKRMKQEIQQISQQMAEQEMNLGEHE